MADKQFITEVISDRPGGSTLGTLAVFRQRGVRCKTERPDVPITPQYLCKLRLSERDREILRYLNEIGYATSGQLTQLFFANAAYPMKLASKRLVLLWQWSVLDRTPSNGLEVFGVQTQLVYSPGPAGILLLSADDPEGKKRKRRGTVLLRHNALLGETVVGIVQTVRTQGWGCTFYGEQGTYTKFQHDGKWVKMRPDGLLYIRHPEGAAELSMFLEMDTSGRELETYTAKVLQYEMYLQSRSWASSHSTFPGVAVIVWASDPAGLTPEAQARRIKLAEARLQRVVAWVKARRRNLGIRWLFARLDQAQADDWRLLTEKGEVRQVHLLSSFLNRHGQERAQSGGKV